MRDNTQKRHSMTQVIEKHLQSLMHDTSTSMGVFVSNVREHYEQSHYLNSMSIEFSQVQDVSVRMARDAEKFKRWLDQDTGKLIPIDMLESIIAAFPAERRWHLQTEISSRQGMTVSAMPESGKSDMPISLGMICKETGEAITAIGRLLDQNTTNNRDLAKLEIEEAIAVLVSMKNKLAEKEVW